MRAARVHELFDASGSTRKIDLVEENPTQLDAATERLSAHWRNLRGQDRLPQWRIRRNQLVGRILEVLVCGEPLQLILPVVRT
jgi:hypothetical protein